MIIIIFIDRGRAGGKAVVSSLTPLVLIQLTAYIAALPLPGAKINSL